MTTAEYILRIFRTDSNTLVTSPLAENGWVLNTMTRGSMVLWNHTFTAEIYVYVSSFLQMLRYVRAGQSKRVCVSKPENMYHIRDSVIYDKDWYPIVIFEGTDSLYISADAYTDVNLSKSLTKLGREFLKAKPMGNLCICNPILKRLGYGDMDVDIEERLLCARNLIEEQVSDVVMV